MRAALRVASLAAAFAAACAEPSTTPVDEATMWPASTGARTPSPTFAFASRADGTSYGLPAAGMTSIADLIAVFPTGALDASAANVFVAPDVTFSSDQCRGGAPAVRDELPITFDGVVTVSPRRYMKVEVCGSDVRHYGSFTVEDDTGGIVVLRDARAATFAVGDRVRVTARAVMLTFGRDPATRAVLVADIEKLPTPERVVAYAPLDGPYGTTHIGRVQRVEGWVHVAPTSLNFNAMMLTSAPVSRRTPGENYTGTLLSCVRTCEVRCQERCVSAEVCADICPDACIRAGTPTIDAAALPACWNIGVDSELGRRGFSPVYGERLVATGPIVSNFDVQMWVMSPEQIEELP